MSGPWKLTPKLAEKIYHYAHFPSSGVSLRQMVQFGSNPSVGTLFRASQFIVEELPIRLAHRVKDLDELPHGLSEMPSIQRVKQWYAQSFEELTTIPQLKLSAEEKAWLYRPQPRAHDGDNSSLDPVKPEGGRNGPSPFIASNTINPSLDEHQKLVKPNARRYFANVDESVKVWPKALSNFNREVTRRLQVIKTRHDGTVSTVAQGVNEWKHVRNKSVIDTSVQQFLDRFYMSRIGIRMMIGQHIALNVEPGLRKDYVGIICTNTNVRELIQGAVDNARFLCETYYGLFEAPKVDIICSPDISFSYVPGHLSHMIFETVKNSLRAVVESHGVEADVFPAVKIIVAQGNEDITVKISDEGGGIPRSEVPLVWTYLYTTVKETPAMETEVSDFKAPLAGFGYGLPISRLYARYFGGDLRLISMEGYGTDVYLHLNRLSSNMEPVD